MAKFDVAALEQWVRMNISQKQIDEWGAQYSGAISRKSQAEVRSMLESVAYELQGALTTAVANLFSLTSSIGGVSYKGWKVRIDDSDAAQPVAYLTYAGDLTRPSLNPNRHPGVVNILSLLDTGFVVDNMPPPEGMWHGKRTVGWMSRRPNPQLESAMNAFNRKYRGQFRADFIDDTFQIEVDK